MDGKFPNMADSDSQNVFMSQCGTCLNWSCDETAHKERIWGSCRNAMVGDYVVSAEDISFHQGFMCRGYEKKQ